MLRQTLRKGQIIPGQIPWYFWQRKPLFLCAKSEAGRSRQNFAKHWLTPIRLINIYTWLIQHKQTHQTKHTHTLDNICRHIRQHIQTHQTTHTDTLDNTYRYIRQHIQTHQTTHTDTLYNAFRHIRQEIQTHQTT